MRHTEYFEESIVLRRVLAFVFHLAGILGAYFLAFQLRFDFDVADWRWAIFRQTLPWVIVAYVACILIFRLYQGLWRFFTLRDCLITAVAFTVGTALSRRLRSIWCGEIRSSFIRDQSSS